MLISRTIFKAESQKNIAMAPKPSLPQHFLHSNTSFIPIHPSFQHHQDLIPPGSKKMMARRHATSESSIWMSLITPTTSSKMRLVTCGHKMVLKSIQLGYQKSITKLRECVERNYFINKFTIWKRRVIEKMLSLLTCCSFERFFQSFY